MVIVSRTLFEQQSGSTSIVNYWLENWQLSQLPYAAMLSALCTKKKRQIFGLDIHINTKQLKLTKEYSDEIFIIFCIYIYVFHINIYSECPN